MNNNSKYYKSNRPLLLDGAVGSLIQQMGTPMHTVLWSSFANISAPEKVTEIHERYISVGSDIITTNTFRTNPAAFKAANLDLDYKNFVSHSILLVRKAENYNEDILIAGSNAPAEDCYQIERTISRSELEFNHKKHIELLWNNQCDFVLNETQSHLDEIEIICEFCYQNEIDYVVSLFFNEELKLLSGESISSVIMDIVQYSPLAISFNCIHNDIFETAVSQLNIDFKYGFYLNCGAGKVTDKNITCGINENQYLNEIKPYLNSKLFFVGACCGAAPEHIKRIKEYFDEIY